MGLFAGVVLRSKLNKRKICENGDEYRSKRKSTQSNHLTSSYFMLLSVFSTILWSIKITKYVVLADLAAVGWCASESVAVSVTRAAMSAR